MTHLCPAPVPVPNLDPLVCLAPIPCADHDVETWEDGLTRYGHSFLARPGRPLPPPAHASCKRHPYPRLPGIVRRFRRCHPTCHTRRNP